LTESGIPLSVRPLGPDPGPGVDVFVLLHGYGASSFSWRYWAPALAARGHVLLVDLKGFGDAPRPDDGRYSVADQARLVHDLLVRRGLESVTLVGHSMGGAVALVTALRLADEGSSRLVRLALVSGAAYRQRFPPFMSLARYSRFSRAALTIIGPRLLAGLVLRTIVYEPASVTREQIQGYAAGLSERAVQRVLIDTALQLLPDDLDALTARDREIDVPTLLLWGRQDRVVPLQVGLRLARELPRARMEIIERCGHLPAEERPDESRRVLSDWLDSTPGLSAPGASGHLDETRDQEPKP
jgi:pimeloyl-ACP methyl ester carboxylesterase